MERVSALVTEDFRDIIFTAIERRQVLSAIIQQSEDDDDAGDQDDDTGELTDAAQDTTSREREDTNAEVANNEVIPAAQLLGEIEEITKAKGLNVKESIQELADLRAREIRERRRRLETAHAHIGMNLIPLDEKTVARLTNYQRQINADISRHLNNLLRSQALRSGQAVPLPISLDVNVVGEQGNGAH
jgi:hypothetical protein